MKIKNKYYVDDDNKYYITDITLIKKLKKLKIWIIITILSTLISFFSTIIISTLLSLYGALLIIPLILFVIWGFKLGEQRDELISNSSEYKQQKDLEAAKYAECQKERRIQKANDLVDVYDILESSVNKEEKIKLLEKYMEN